MLVVRTLVTRFRCCFFRPAEDDSGTVNSSLVDVQLFIIAGKFHKVFISCLRSETLSQQAEMLKT
jgi:hypothetical protein